MGIPGGPNPLLMRRAAAAATDDGYQIEGSVRFDISDQANLQRTLGGINKRKFTVSVWFKKALEGEDMNFLGNLDTTSWNTGWAFFVDANNKLTFYNDAKDGAAINMRKISTQELRDPSAWYHGVCVVDTANSVAEDRIRLYLNGERITSFSSSTNPAQDTEVDHGDADQPYNIGYQYEYTAGLIAEPMFIDGLALGPAAFGEFTSSGTWNPKAFALPVPNDGTTWSGMLTSAAGFDGSGTSNGSPTRAFTGDGPGNTTGQWCYTAANNMGESNAIIFTPTGGLEINQSLEIWAGRATTTETVHTEIDLGSGYEPAIVSTSGTWITLFEGKGTLTKFKTWKTAGNGGENALSGVRVDGVELIDGQTDKTYEEEKAVSYLNDGTTWSSVQTAAFDGVATTDSAGNASFTGVNGNFTITFPEAITVSSSLKLQMYASISSFDTYCDVEVNGSETTMSVDTSQGNQAGIYASNFTGSMTTLKVTAKGNSNIGLAQVIVDGTILVNGRNDGVGANSFHLKFNDTTTNARVGWDSLNEGTILEPVKTGQAVSGYWDDPNKANLVLALPGTDLKDYHATIKGSGSNRTETYSGTALSTGTFKLYGSSISYDNSSDSLNFPDHADWDIGTGDYCIEAWVHIDTHNSDRMLVAAYTNSGSTAWQLYYGGGSSNNQFVWFVVNSGFGAGNNYVESTTLSTNCVNKWVHIAGTVNGTTDKIAIYINGKKEAETSYSGTITTYGDVLGIGYRPGTTGATHVGKLNDVRIYKGAIKYSSDFTPPTRHDFAVNNLAIAATHPNNGTVWSTYLTSTNGWWPNFTNVNSFDGSPEAGNYTEGGANATITFEPPGGITYSSKVEVISKTGTTAVFNGGSGVAMSNNTYITMATGSGTLNTLVFTRSDSTGGQLAGIKVDGTILQDSVGNTEDGIDAFVDSPTNYAPSSGSDGDGGVTRGNYATLNAIDNGGLTLRQGNLAFIDQSTAGWDTCRASMYMNSGKWYMEMTIGTWNGSGAPFLIGVADNAMEVTGVELGQNNNSWCFLPTGQKRHNSSTSSHGSAWSSGKVIGVAVDLSGGLGSGKMWVSINGTWQASGNPATGANAAFTDIGDTGEVAFAVGNAGGNTSDLYYVNFGARAFKYAAPTGFSCLCTQNLDDLFGANSNAAGDKNNPAKYFGISLYTGKGTTQDVKGLLFEPGLVFIKSRSHSNAGMFFDQIRTNSSDQAEYLFPDATTASGGPAADVHKAWLTYGYQLGGNTHSNTTDHSYVGWAWEAGTTETAYVKYLTGGIDSNFPAINAFDGSLTSDSGVGCRTNQNAQMTFEPPTDIAFTKLRIYANNDNSGNNFTNTWKVNGTDVTSAVNSAAQTSYAWIDVTSSVSSPLDKIEVISTASGSNPRIQAIEIDDVILTANGTGITGQTEARWTNTACGFSMIYYTGTGVNDTKVGHGLVAKPKFTITKSRSRGDENWFVYHTDNSDATKTLYFDLNSAAGDNSLYWNDTPPNSTVINLGTHNGLNAVNDTYVTYCWTEIEGFSKMSYFIGTGSADGPFVATGFEPRFILTKNVDRGRQWVIWDTDRSPGNYADECLFPDVIDAEATKGPDSGTDNDIDILSNGFKIRNADSAQNADGEKIIYCAFARNPFKTARAR